MATVKMPVSQRFYTQMAMNTSTYNADVSLAQQFLKTCIIRHANMVFWMIVTTKIFKLKKITNRYYYVQKNEDFEHNIYK